MKTFIVGLIVLGAAAVQASAGLISYTSRAVWTGDVGAASWTQDFESFVTDASFQTNAVVAGHLTLLQGGTGNFRNLVDVLPSAQTGEGDLTNFASMFTDFGVTTVSMSFDSPLRAWGGDFFSVEAEGVTLVLNLLGGGTLSVDIPQGTLGTGAFFGFRTTAGEAVTSIKFQSRTDNAQGGEGFPVDNIAAVTTAAPEPGTGMLFGGVLILSGVFSRLRRPRT